MTKKLLIVGSLATLVLASAASAEEGFKYRKLDAADPPCLFLLDENSGQPTGNPVNTPCELGGTIVSPGDNVNPGLRARHGKAADVSSGKSTGIRQHSSRDAASGMATGKRQHSPRDAASGMATGKRQHAPRDAASGMATGKRQHSPRDAASGLPTGKRQHKPVSVTDSDTAQKPVPPQPRGKPVPDEPAKPPGQD